MEKKFLTNEIRRIWLDFFQSKDHLVLEPKSLIPNNDPSLLWINSGVATLKDYFTGAKTPIKNRLTNSQKSIRTNDIFNVGYTSRHHTMFEMLGNFSIGDYFKEEAIEFAYELLTTKFNIDVNKLYFSVFKDDNVAYDKWISLNINPSHIIKCDRDRNFWDVGQGPCGPCTEIHYDRGEKYDKNKLGEKLFFEDIENDRYIEIWNIVFSQFNNDGKNNYTELARKNIDTGAGLERLACILQDVPTNYDTDLFLPLINEVEKYSDKKYDINNYFIENFEQKEINHCFRVIADHMRAVVFAMSDGAIASNNGRGSIIRKLIRRSMVCCKKLNISDCNILISVAQKVSEIMKDYYSYLLNEIDNVCEILRKEIDLFNKTLEKGYKLFSDAINNKVKLDGEVIFKLVDTFGFPFDTIKDLASQKNIEVDEVGFNKKLELHKEISRANLEIKGMSKQAEGLINFTKESSFLYDETEIDNVQVIGLFDENFDAIESFNNEGWIVTNKTVLYATSGGQIHDEGVVIKGNDSFEVIDVIKGPNGQHFVQINSDGIKISLNDSVDIKINKQFRNLVSKNHSVEHILEKVMRENIDSNIKQLGAFKSPDKMTFDFQLSKKLDDSQINSIEEKINVIIKNGSEVETILTDLEEAKKSGAVAHFDEVYSKIKGKLRLVCMKGQVNEICGGTHVRNLNEIEEFMIVKLVSKGSGMWRLECITSSETINKYINIQIEIIQQQINDIKMAIDEYKITNEKLLFMLNNLNFLSSKENYRFLNTELKQIKELFDEEMNVIRKNNEEKSIIAIKCVERIISQSTNAEVGVYENKEWKEIVNAFNELANENKEKLFIGIGISEKMQYIVVTQSKNFKANEIIKQINTITNGVGGGKENTAQGGSSDKNKMEDLLSFVSGL